MSVDCSIGSGVGIEDQLLAGVSQIELGECLPVGQRCKNVLHQGKRIGVHKGSLVHGQFVIPTDSDTTVSLHYGDNRCGPL